VPGLGQLYCLLVGSFFAWLLLTLLAYVIFWPVGLVLHVFAIVHAFQICRTPMVLGELPVSAVTKTEPVKDAKPVIDSKLFIAGLVLVGILGAIALVVLPSRNAPDMPSGIPPLPIRRSYAWLDQCGTGCEQKLGYVEVMAGAGESDAEEDW
jgi:hypothetical protein